VKQNSIQIKEVAGKSEAEQHPNTKKWSAKPSQNNKGFLLKTRIYQAS